MNRKILIVEDDEALLKILRLLLENSYDITLAMNGKQGLKWPLLNVQTLF